MRILITGKDGQVATSLRERLTGHDLLFAQRPLFDLGDDRSIETTVETAAPDLIISAAAYTSVDRAEDEPDIAMQINALGPGRLAKVASRHGIPVIHLSTDYVFDGSGDQPWREHDRVGPLSVYGATKLAGERAVLEAANTHAILRTSWVYSPFSSNFVKTMLRLAPAHPTIRVVDDQFGCPTSALDIANAIAIMVDQWALHGEIPWHGVYHVAGTGSTNWANFARAIFVASRVVGGPTADVVGIAGRDYPTRAARPVNSRLDCGRFARAFGHHLPDWQVSLADVVNRCMPT